MANLIGKHNSLRFGFVWGVLTLLLAPLSVSGDVFLLQNGDHLLPMRSAEIPAGASDRERGSRWLDFESKRY